jgi:hypothetical protein
MRSAGGASEGRGPIYIGGLDRSGKTTMAAFLSSHPSIAIPQVGSNMWTYFYGQYGSLERVANFERCLDALMSYKHVRYLDPDPVQIRREFATGPRTYARLFALFLQHYAERRGKPRWGAQTGLIERYADPLFEAYPGLKIVHMVRDPRDRYEASLARWPDGRGRAGGATARWKYSVGLAEKNLHRFPGRYKVVRFETMVQWPEETIRDVCEFLDEEFTPAMLSMQDAPKHRNRLAGGSVLAPEEVPLSAEHIGQFRRGVPEPEIEFIQLHAGRLMEAYGYGYDAIALSRGDRVRFVVRDWPNQAARMAAWRTVEAVHQQFPRWFGRAPGRRMIVETQIDSTQSEAAT